ncbi:MAG: phage integrase family protein [Caballeronia mineralivorans]|jgi:integrase/recombinase XerD|nr:phage integrase family protein [Caballeronia mineralivorans]MEA3099540.1 integrase/recombinase XerD [Caballeronia mineralivorans]
MAELARYRRHCGPAALPYSGETIPLLLPIGGTHRAMTRSAVHLIIKQVFDNAIDHLLPTGEAHERATERLRQASAHWLRHTAGSHMMDGQVDLRYARDNLGHKSEGCSHHDLQDSLNGNITAFSLCTVCSRNIDCFVASPVRLIGRV